MSLPISVTPFADESAFGYLLRLSWRNGSNLAGMRRLLRLPETQFFEQKHSTLLAHLCEVEALWFEQRLPYSLGSADQMPVVVGHSLLASNHWRRKRPQVCPQCIHSLGYCRLEWEFSMVTVCDVHRCKLVDRCMRCGAALRWDRPSIDVGHCGHCIASELEPDVPNGSLFWVGAEVRKRLSRAIAVTPTPEKSMSSSLDALSLGGFCMLLHAFGALERPLQVFHASQLRCQLTTMDWQSVLLRACERWRVLCEHPQETARLADEIVSAGLLRVIDKSEDLADVQTMAEIYVRLYGQSLDVHARRSAQLRQHVLF